MRTKTKRRIAIAVGCVAILLMFGFVGGAEMGWMPWKSGIALAALCEAVWAGAWWKAGVIRCWR